MLRAGGAEQLAKHAGGFLGHRLFARRQHNQGVRLQAQGALYLLGKALWAVDKFGNAPGDFTLFVHLKPVGFLGGLHFCLGA